MKFLIDECLHTSLVTVAHDHGHACEHVNFLGLRGYTALYAKQELHAGLVIILPNVTPARQRELFQAAISHIGMRDLINTVLEVKLAGATAICQEYLSPNG